jgi:HD-GYP domain-containing protein (c-di-GMP phosphodiesterase class II)
MNRANLFIPLEIKRLRSGEVINFNIYVRSENAGGTNKYLLFCRRGEMFNPGSLFKIKLDDIYFVYYQRFEKDQVEEYLARTGKFTNAKGTQQADQNNCRQVAEPKQRLVKSGVITNEFYFPLAVKNLQPGIEVNFDVFLRMSVIGKDNFEYNLFLPKGEICRFALLNELHEKGMKIVYINKRDESNVFRYLYHNLSLQLKNDKLMPVKKAELIYDAALLWTRRFYYLKYNRTQEELETGFKLINYLLNTFNQDRHYHQWLPKIRGYDGNLYVHCLNTCLLGLAFAKYLRWTDDKIIEFGQGILLHDLGMVEVPPAVLNKPVRLSESEMGLVKRHPADSHRILKKIEFLSKNSALMVLQHHETGDGSGYPMGLRLPLINHWARVLRIIDSYEALTSRRSWRDKFDSLKALKVMRQEWLNSGIFDINYLVEFVKFLSAK